MSWKPWTEKGADVSKLHSALKHTPYDGSAKPFTIGLQQLDLKDWIEADEHLPAYLDEKERLFAAYPNKVFVEESGTRHAQREVLDLLAAHLVTRFPDLYRHDGDAIEIVGTDRRVELHHAVNQPLRTAASLVQEDLLLMRRRDNGDWRLVAASLSFPSSWTLTEKFGRAMDEIHAPVPGFHAGTRNAELIRRMFDNLPASQPVSRVNWSLQPDGDLYHPLSSHYKNTGYADDEILRQTFVRIERQTLRKLPECQDILFTIRIHLNPLSLLRKHEDGHRLAGHLADQIEALDVEKLAYKGLSRVREKLLRELRGLSEQGIIG